MKARENSVTAKFSYTIGSGGFYDGNSYFYDTNDYLKALGYAVGCPLIDRGEDGNDRIIGVVNGINTYKIPDSNKILVEISATIKTGFGTSEEAKILPDDRKTVSTIRILGFGLDSEED